MKTRAQLEAELRDQTERCDGLRKDLYADREERNSLRDEIKAVRENFADLKKRLSEYPELALEHVAFEAETALARLRGYMERVHEDDVVRDGMVEIEDDQGKRMVPRRPPPLRYYAPPDPMSLDSYGRQKKTTHWTSY